jgi:glycosyltransferase involved in cell wall biosynthesis
LFKTVIPSKIFECMAMGIPTIMSVPEGEATAIIRSSRSGLVVGSENVSEIADAVLKLRNNKELYHELKAGSILAAPTYSRDILANDMVNVLSKLKV